MPKERELQYFRLISKRAIGGGLGREGTEGGRGAGVEKTVDEIDELKVEKLKVLSE